MGKRGMSIRRSLSLLLALVMVIGLLPVSVFAAEDKYGLDDTFWKADWWTRTETSCLKPGDTTYEVTVGVEFTRTSTINVDNATTFDMVIGDKTLHSTITVSGQAIHLETNDPGVSTSTKNVGSGAIIDNTIVFEAKLTVGVNDTVVKTSGTWAERALTEELISLEKPEYEGFAYVQYKAGSKDVYDMPSPTGVEWDLWDGDYSIVYTEPARDGYNFLGWKCSLDDKIYKRGESLPCSILTENGQTVELTAQWAKDTDSEVTVKFDKNGTDAELLFADSMTVTKGEDFVIPTGCLPTRDGYKFKGWSTNQNADSGDMPGTVITGGVTANTTYYAIWAREKVTVTVPASVQGVRSLQYVYTEDGRADKIGVGGTRYSPDKGSTFGVQFRLAEKYDLSTLVVTANGVALQGKQGNTDTDGLTLYTYSFRADSDTTVEISTPQEKTFTVALPLSEKYSAVFTDPAAAMGATTATVGYDGTYSFTVTPFAGYRVTSVKVNGGTLNADTNGVYTVRDITGPQNVGIVVEDIEMVTVTYIVDGNYFTTRQVQKGTQMTEVTNVQLDNKVGYINSGWYTDGTYATQATGTVDKDLELYAKHVPVQGKIAYDLKGADTPDTINPTTKVYGQGATLSATVPTRTGYTFLGWGTAEDATVASYLPGEVYSTEITEKGAYNGETDVEGAGTVTLYAVWEQKTYTITLSSGSGYTIHADRDLTVPHGERFDFRVIVDAEHAEKAPDVWLNWYTDDGTRGSQQLATPAGTKMDDEAVKYQYYFTVTNDTVINVVSFTNTVYTVEFKYRGLNNELNDQTWMTREVPYNQCVEQPLVPTIPGYTFAGWYTVTKTGDTEEEAVFNFATPITADVTVYAKYTAKTPAVTWPSGSADEGWTLTVTSAVPTPEEGQTYTSPYNVTYGSNVEFTITVAAGYDASGLTVGAEGKLLSPLTSVTNDDGSTTLTYKLANVTENTEITVGGVTRKTITITYMANALDEVRGMPAPESVVYSLGANDGTISSQTPSRIGYAFLGWSTNSERDPKKFNSENDTNASTGKTFADEDFLPSEDAPFTKDTTLYAVWRAVQSTLTLSVSGAAGTGNPVELSETASISRWIQYEGEEVTLQAALTTGAKGQIVFYKAADKDDNEGTIIATVPINGKTAGTTVTVGGYKAGGLNEFYFAKFEPETEKGFEGSVSNKVAVGVFSKALSWPLATDGSNKIADNANVIEITDNAANKVLGAGETMTVGQTYTLRVKTEGITGLERLDGDKPVLGEDYEIIWEYRTDTAKADWTTMDAAYTDKATCQVTAEYSKYVFRAKIRPIGDLYVKAAKFENDVLTGDVYDSYLYTKPTGEVQAHETKAALEILGADAEGANLAQFEGKTVSLKATITVPSNAPATDAGTKDTPVTTGYVQFYRVVEGSTEGELLNTSLIAVDENGVAVLDGVVVKAYDLTKSKDKNKDTFYVKYVSNMTGKASESEEVSLLVKSTAMTWKLTAENKLDANANKLTIKDQANNPVDSMIAGQTYTLELPAVLRIDGRKDDPKVNTNYKVIWEYKQDGQDWATYNPSSSSTTLTITSYVEGQTFRARVEALDGAFNDLKLTAAYDGSALKTDGYAPYLVTQETKEVDVQATQTTLAITGADEEKADTVGIEGKHLAQYEKKTVKLIATVNTLVTETVEDEPVEKAGPAVDTGYVQFYRVKDGKTELLNQTLVPVDANGKAELDVVLSDYDTEAAANENKDVFYAVYQKNANYNTSSSEKTEKALVNTVYIKSAAISWALTDEFKIAENANVLGIYTDADCTESADAMVANNTYYLQLPAVCSIDGRETELKNGTHYTVQWQYLDTTSNTWTDYQGTAVGDVMKIDPEFSQFKFRAVVSPTSNARSAFDTAARYEGTTLKCPPYAEYLVTGETDETTVQATTTTIEILGAETEAKSVMINGSPAFNWGEHLVQYEGQTVTLKATVVDANGHPVTSGEVLFYRQVRTDASDNTVTDANSTLLNENGVSVSIGNDGVATITYTVPEYNAAVSASDVRNCSYIYAKYLGNSTYDASSTLVNKTFKSDAVKNMVFSRSAQIKTPIIDSDKQGNLSVSDTNLTPTSAASTSTKYTKALVSLPAGEKIVFTLRTKGNAEADYSVVALDGREIDAGLYDIQWFVQTGLNEVAAAGDSAQTVYVLDQSKDGDSYRVKLTGKGVFEGSEASSMPAVIGTKKDVTITVTATDEILATTDVDVYQLDEITLTATVRAKDDNVTMQPEGNVTFYYSTDNGTTWTMLTNKADGTSNIVLKEVEGEMRASITTDQLPVTVDTNTKQDVIISATYSGNGTFNGLYAQGATDTEQLPVAIDNTDVTTQKVTVYSSVVFAGSAENYNKTQDPDGITIKADGKLAATESNVVLKLDPVYTLDHKNNPTEATDLSRLKYGEDYTVQWEVLQNAGQYVVKDGEKVGSYDVPQWTAITGETGQSYTITSVPQGVAYRARITVLENRDAVRGSYTSVEQKIAGRRTYYSNVLVADLGTSTMSASVTTSANTQFNQEGIVEGELATIHVLSSGAASVTPINTEVTVSITKKDDPDQKEVYSEVKSDVNGYVSFDWDTTGVTPGVYTLTIKGHTNNGYDEQTITRELIVRDDNYTLSVTKSSKVYNGSTQGINWTLTGIDYMNDLAQKSVTVQYYQDGKLVEPKNVGTYKYVLSLPAGTYWTGKNGTDDNKTEDDKDLDRHVVTGDFIITARQVSIADVTAQAKVYNGQTNVNLQEIILEDAEVNADGTVSNDSGVVHGDSVYAVATATTESAKAGETTLKIDSFTLAGDDAANYQPAGGYTEEHFNIQRSQVKGDIADLTYAYTGEEFQVSADKIYLIDQYGNQITNYETTYYYHNGDGVEKVDGLKAMGKYTVIARPADQDNYKGGATQTIYVAETAVDAEAQKQYSAVIDIADTVHLYDGQPHGVTVKSSVEDAENKNVKVEYFVNGAYTTTAPSNVGRYLVKAETTNEGVTDTAYGILTIVMANPELKLEATGATYNSARYDGTPSGTYNGAAFPAGTYYTWQGAYIQGTSYDAPTEAGNYVITAHVPQSEDGNYAAHEVSANYTIKKAPLTIAAEELQRWQYGSYPDMVATFTGFAADGAARDTQLRDVQVQPEFLFNEAAGGYTNHAQDQVGVYPIDVRNALVRNYDVTYVANSYSVTQKEPMADLAIHTMLDGKVNGEAVKYAHFGDTIQLYPYGYYDRDLRAYNTSSTLTWEISRQPAYGTVYIDEQTGFMTVYGVGEFEVKLTRGSGSAVISATLTITALRKEVSIDVPDVDKIYNAELQTYDGTVTVSDSGASGALNEGENKTRVPVGSQVVAYQIEPSNAAYVSEQYSGLFTIHVKDAKVYPVAQTTVYGTKEGFENKVDGKFYTVDGKVGNVNPVENVGAAAVTDAYDNVDVYDGYEILLSGTENRNYHVTYVTKNNSETSAVTKLDMTFTTGTLARSLAQTSGYLKDNAKVYNEEGYDVTGKTFTSQPVDRMYGEVNPAMDYLFESFITGDSEADLATLGAWLDKYVNEAKPFNNINGDANVKFDKSNHLNGHRSSQYIDGRTNTDAGYEDYKINSMLGSEPFKNYNVTPTDEATQNIYQRPFTIGYREGLTAATFKIYKPSIMNNGSVDTAELLKIILANLTIEKYNGVGGLAELLNHNISDVITGITDATIDGNTVKFKLEINPNYWTEDVNQVVKLENTKIVVKYGTLGRTSSSVTMYMVDANGVEKITDLEPGTNVTYYIYKRNDSLALTYSAYRDNATPERAVTMTKVSNRTGVYTASYATLPDGNYVMFAIADGYTIIE